MALIDIEYGSLASSETMNKNFTYLDNKIEESADAINTSISSILSNIATINSRLNEMSDEFSDSVSNLNTTIEDYKSKTKLLVNKSCMVPDWANCVSVELIPENNYEVPTNGYLLLLSDSMDTNCNLTVDGSSISLKSENSSFPLVTIPVYDGNLIGCDILLSNVYFLPMKEISIEDF